MTGIPLIDMLVNIDCFTTTHEDREKVLRILKELFNHCTTMKKLLLKHHRLILPNLVNKYDSQCQIYINKANLNPKNDETVVGAHNDSVNSVKFGKHP
jgi:hypothetical protein